MLNFADLLKILVPLFGLLTLLGGAVVKTQHYLIKKLIDESKTEPVQVGPQLPQRRGDTDPDLHVCSHHYEVIRDQEGVKGELSALKQVTDEKFSNLNGKVEDIGKDVKALVRHTGAHRRPEDERSHEG